MARPKIESKQKAKAIEIAKIQPFYVGDKCYIKRCDLDPTYYKAGTDKGDRLQSVTITEIGSFGADVTDNEAGYKAKPSPVTSRSQSQAY